MSCQRKNCTGNTGCKKYQKKEDYRQAKRQYPNIDNPLEKWVCTAEEEATCKDHKPYPARMLQGEFGKKQDELLADMPEEFKSVLSAMAWEMGHSAGFEEVINYLKSLVDDLQEPIELFACRIRRQQLSELRKEYPSLCL